jgi:hypothetical protein
LLSIPIGIPLLYLISALIVVITGSADADLSKLADSIFNSGAIGTITTFAIYFLGIAFPARYILVAVTHSAVTNLLNVTHIMLIAIGVLGGVLASLAIRELLIAF